MGELALWAGAKRTFSPNGHEVRGGECGRRWSMMVDVRSAHMEGPMSSPASRHVRWGSQFPRNETPAEAMQSVAAFRFCRSPVLNAWYCLFSPGHGESASSYLEKYQAASPTADSPAIFVSWYDAWAFAQWARWDEGQCRLPREYEWEYAAKAGTPWDQNYWWGDEFDGTKCNADMNVGQTTPPSAAHANPGKLEDILGNVWEWCEDWYWAVYDRDNEEEAALRVFRCGSWRNGARSCRAAFRRRNGPANRLDNLGFRVAAVPLGGASKKNRN
jgi:formylglycine-generating enzyme required for sulfatase activity